MKFSRYVKDKINYTLGFIVYCMIIIAYTGAMQIDKDVSIVIITISLIFFVTGVIINYWKKNKYIKNIEKIMDGLDEKYLISEVIDKPKREENLAYYKLLKRANKSMLENVTDVKNTQKEYKEYIESWVHEIKTPKFVEDFANYLVAIRNLSQVYIKNMTVTIEQFLEFINVHKFKNKYNTIEDITLNEIRSLNNSDIYSFIFFLAESHYQNNSRVIKIEHLKTFFDYLFNIKHTIFKEPFKKINSERKLEKKLPNYLSLDEAKRLINLYENSTDEIEIRDNAMLHIFLNCGLRLSEIKNLNIEDINLDDNKFTIIGKGNKERTNYLNKKTKDALIKYLKIRDNSHDNNKKHNNALFLTFYGYRMSQFTINKIVKRAYRKAELDENVYTVHTLRHTCATLLYRSGVNIKTIQELLGHVHIDTTEIYTHLDNQEVKDVMFEHPLAQFKMEDALAYCA